MTRRFHNVVAGDARCPFITHACLHEELNPMAISMRTLKLICITTQPKES